MKTCTMALLGAGILGISYGIMVAAKKYLKPIKILSVQQTIKISQEIHNQVFLMCVTYVQQSHQFLKSTKRELTSVGTEQKQMWKQVIKNKLVELYEGKQQLILGKYEVEESSYRQSLNKYKQNKQIIQLKTKILQLLQRAANLKPPDYTTSDEIQQSFTKQQICNVYIELNREILITVINVLKMEKVNNPDFNSQNHQEFRKAMKNVNMYDFKIQFLKNRGFMESWGKPLQIFNKLCQYHKAQNNSFKKQIRQIQQVFNKTIQTISQDINKLTQQNLCKIYDQKLQAAGIKIDVKVTDNNRRQFKEQDIQIVGEEFVSSRLPDQKKMEEWDKNNGENKQ